MDTPPIRAVSNRQVDAVRLLIEKGADVNAKDNGGDTPLHKAANRGQVDAVHLLIEKVADVNAKDKYGKTALDVAGTGKGVTEYNKAQTIAILKEASKRPVR